MPSDFRLHHFIVERFSSVTERTHTHETPGQTNRQRKKRFVSGPKKGEKISAQNSGYELAMRWRFAASLCLSLTHAFARLQCENKF